MSPTTVRAVPQRWGALLCGTVGAVRGQLEKGGGWSFLRSRRSVCRFRLAETGTLLDADNPRGRRKIAIMISDDLVGVIGHTVVGLRAAAAPDDFRHQIGSWRCWRTYKRRALS